MIAADLLATVWWPMVAVTLVLCGMTLASGGRPSTGERRAAATAPGGRRATDRLPGDRTMVVVTGDPAADTIRRAMSAARGHDTDAGVATPRARWETRA